MRPISSKITLEKEKEGKGKGKKGGEEKKRGYTLSFYNDYFGGNGLKNLARYKK